VCGGFCVVSLISFFYVTSFVLSVCFSSLFFPPLLLLRPCPLLRLPLLSLTLPPLLAPLSCFYARQIASTKSCSIGSAGGPANPPLGPPGRTSCWRDSLSPPSNSSPRRTHVCVVPACGLDPLCSLSRRKKAVNAAGRPRSKASALKKLSAVLNRSQSLLQRHRVSLLVRLRNQTPRRIASGTSSVSRRHAAGADPLLLVRDPKATRTAGRPFYPISTSRPWRYLAWFVSHAVKSPFEKPALISASKLSASGPPEGFETHSGATQSVLHRHPLCADLSKSRQLNPRNGAWYPKAILTFTMQSPRYVAKYGAINFVSFSAAPGCIVIPRRIGHRMQNALAPRRLNRPKSEAQ